MPRREWDPERMWREYRDGLARTVLALGTQRVYASRVREFLTWLGDRQLDALSDPLARDAAVEAFRSQLVVRCSPATVNNYLAAIDHFYRTHRGLGPAPVAREHVPPRVPLIAGGSARERFRQSVLRLASVRDQAICLLMLEEGLRAAELAALDLGQVQNPVLARWLTERAAKSPGTANKALFLGRSGRRMSERTIRRIVSSAANQAGLTITPRQLRRSTNTEDLRRRVEDTRRIREQSRNVRQRTLDQRREVTARSRTRIAGHMARTATSRERAARSRTYLPAYWKPSSDGDPPTPSEKRWRGALPSLGVALLKPSPRHARPAPPTLTSTVARTTDRT